MLLVRLDRLDDAARQVVRAASVAGRKVAHDLLAAASGLAAAELEEGLRQAVEMNVLVPGDGRYSFRHALLGEAVYDDLLPGERVRLHAQYAEALREGRGRGTAAELARHARLAHDLDTALDASIRAGDEAMAVGGPDEAAHHYEQALELLADPAPARQRRRRPLQARRQRRRGADHLRPARPARPRCSPSSSTGCPDDARRPGGPGCSPPAPTPCAHRDPTRTRSSSSQRGRRRCCPRTPAGCAPRCSPPTPGCSSGYGSYDEAQAAGLEALALAERLDLHELASDVITTLSQAQEGRPQGGAARGARRRGRPGRGDRRRPRRAAGPLPPRPLLRGLGRVGEAETWFRSAMKAAADGRPPLRAVRLRVPLAAGLDPERRGDWDEVLRLTDTSDEQRAADPAALLEACALLVESRPRRAGGRAGPRAAPVLGARGPVAIYSVVGRDGRRRRSGDDPAAVIAVYDDAVAVLGRIWHEWFSARIRLAAIAIGALADACRGSAPPSARRASPRSSGCTPTGTRCSTSTPTRPATGVPRAAPG